MIKGEKNEGKIIGLILPANQISIVTNIKKVNVLKIKTLKYF